MNPYKFTSEFNYSLTLPSNWSEYELEDEKETNGFFNAESNEWTGNLRVSPVIVKESYFKNIIKDEKKEHQNTQDINWGHLYGISFSYKADDTYQYFWYLIQNKTAFFCSFTINLEHKNSEENKTELKNVIEILKSIQTS